MASVFLSRAPRQGCSFGPKLLHSPRCDTKIKKWHLWCGRGSPFISLFTASSFHWLESGLVTQECQECQKLPMHVNFLGTMLQSPQKRSQCSFKETLRRKERMSMPTCLREQAQCGVSGRRRPDRQWMADVTPRSPQNRVCCESQPLHQNVACVIFSILLDSVMQFSFLTLFLQVRTLKFIILVMLGLWPEASTAKHGIRKCLPAEPVPQVFLQEASAGIPANTTVICLGSRRLWEVEVGSVRAFAPWALPSGLKPYLKWSKKWKGNVSVLILYFLYIKDQQTFSIKGF